MNGGDPKPLAGFDHGTPPPAVLQQQARMRDLLEDEAPAPSVNGKNSQNYEALDRAIENMPAESRDSESIAERRLSVVRVTLEYLPDNIDVPSFRLEFDVGEVCVREHYISLLVVSDLGFKPTKTMRFKLTTQERGRTSVPYIVIFAGAEFEFKSVKVRGISFLRDKKAEESIQ